MSRLLRPGEQPPRTCDWNREWLNFDMQKAIFFRECAEREAAQTEPPLKHLSNRRWGKKMPPGWLWDGSYYTYLGVDWRLSGAFDYSGFSCSVSGTPPVDASEYRYQVDYQIRKMNRWLWRNWPRDRHPAAQDPPKKARWKKASSDG